LNGKSNSAAICSRVQFLRGARSAQSRAKAFCVDEDMISEWLELWGAPMRIGSSVIAARLSNWSGFVLNKCKKSVLAALPQSCLLCSAPSGMELLCRPCHAQLPWLKGPRCPQCAVPTFDGSICGACLAHPPRYDWVSAAFVYAYPLDKLIHSFKYNGNLALAPMFAEALAASVNVEADVLVPMPLAPSRLRERGFNQALELARSVGRIIRTPVVRDACRRVRDTLPQASLPWGDRAKNIRRAFVCDADLKGKRVAVIDDVLTTGATLNELARNLRQAGAAEVYGWVVARALRA
jgi:ComF family protein